VLGLVLVALLLVGAGVVLLALVSGPDEAAVVNESPSDLAAAPPGPYDLSPAPPGFDLAQVVRAKFVSLSFPESSELPSMMLTQDRPEFQEMAAAVAGAEKVSDEASPAAEQAVTVTFVTEERETATLTLAEGALFFWQGATFEAAGDLQSMVEQAGQLLQ
jgi:hypothetical protein